VPECVATVTIESGDLCYDNVDNDCNGATDHFDSNCGLYPVLYTAKV
jgi:hypothetical protein